jgi:hypothetical protein
MGALGPRTDTTAPGVDVGGGGDDDVWARPDVAAPPMDVAEPPDAGSGGGDVPAPIDTPEPADGSADAPEDTAPWRPDGEGPLCPAPGPGTVNPLLDLGLSESADHESGIDLDHNPATCSPRPNCSDGVDNSFADIARILRNAIIEQVLAEEFHILPAIQPLTSDVRDGSFRIALWPAAPVDAECDAATVKCDVVLYAESDDGSCGPAWLLDDGHLEEGNVLVAGLFGSEHILEIELSDDLPPLEVSVYALQLRARIDQLEGGRIVRMSGTLGGAIERLDLLDLLELLIDDELTLAAVLAVIQFSLDSDIDVDGDGAADADSFAISFTAREGTVVGVETDGLPFWMRQQ